MFLKILRQLLLLQSHVRGFMFFLSLRSLVLLRTDASTFFSAKVQLVCSEPILFFLKLLMTRPVQGFSFGQEEQRRKNRSRCHLPKKIDNQQNGFVSFERRFVSNNKNTFHASSCHQQLLYEELIVVECITQVSS